MFVGYSILKLHSLGIPQGVADFWRVFTFFEGKGGGGGKVTGPEGSKGGCRFFLDAIERLSICNIIDKPLDKWRSLSSSSTKGVFKNVLNYNVLYFVQ